MAILLIIYMVLGYMAVPHTIWRNSTIIEFKLGSAFTQRVILGTIQGWALIPWWLIGSLGGRR